uniref:maleylacetoacetate isomerase n=1 Tax=Phallusia mammillata TaxID=59560 RepID=A0A6F9DE35_9ASCI|nr:maleylacetoacetate isomerase-like [Phallusia mammillata]
MSLKLYSYWRSTCSWRVRICLALKGIKSEIVPVHLVQDGGMQHKPEYRDVNPLGQVPTLVDDNHVISQSMAIMEYIEEKFKSQGPPLLPDDFAERAKVRQLCETIASGIQPLQNLSVLQKIGETKVDWANHWITVGFQALEKMLTMTAGTYCVGNNITMADACLVPQVYNANRFKVKMEDFPIITRINATLQEHKAFIEASPDNQVDCPNKN